ncbi:hypothetical protein SAMN02927937_01757 [Paenimyroides aquimaris]|uniref:Uncharacterized protein n=1 Tax=Paenimyroides marinum TaxID=1159016 RepID=A0A1H6L9K0_9FLAO|nr:hypothetical protein [Paenimyroides aquimaris]SEH85015.1 hypothetical protein SAMN02927937_01757 [Paenimyroides aquimaris]
MKKIIFIFLVTSVCHSQEITYFKDKVDYIENELSNLLKDREYIIYGTIHKMHLILKKNDDFYQFIFTNNTNNMYLSDINILGSNCLELVFNKLSYTKGIIDTDSDFYRNNPIEILVGDPLYFSYNLDYKNRYCEYFIAMGIKPKPMKQQVSTYLNSLMLKYSYDCEW